MIESNQGKGRIEPEAQRGNTGNNMYSIEGVPIEVTWKIFQPSTAEHSEPLKLHGAIIFLPGYPYGVGTQEIANICQTIANCSLTDTYALDTFTLPGYSHALLAEAKAAHEFLKEMGIEQATIAASSQGGDQAMHLTALAQDEILINGLLLYGSIGLSEQTFPRLIVNCIKEFMHKPNYPPNYHIATLKARQKQIYTEGVDAIKSYIRRLGVLHFARRVSEEIKEAISINSSAPEITAPVIIIHGAKDRLSEIKEVIPHQGEQGKTPYIENIHEREQFLQRTLFKKSPLIKFVVGEKMGYHGLQSFRTEQVTKASFYLLERWYRQRQQKPAIGK